MAHRSRRKLDVRGSVALVGSVLCWSAMPVFLRGLTVHVDPWTANGLRYPLAALLYWPVLALGLRSGTLNRDLLRRAVVPAALALCGQILWAMAPYYIEASRIGFLIKISTVWALAGALILFPDERPLLTSLRFHAGLVLAVAGFVALALARGALKTPETRAGVLILFGCGFFFGLYGVSVRYCLRDVWSPLAFAVVAQYVSAILIPLMFLRGDPSVVLGLSPMGWLLIVTSSIVGIAISHVLFYVALRRMGAAISNLMSLLTAFVTLALAHLTLGETMGGEELGAGGVMLVGGALLLLAQERIHGGMHGNAEEIDREASPATGEGEKPIAPPRVPP